MLIDGRSVPAGTELATDLCIVGAGAAGITLGLALAGQGFRVLLLESGGFDPDVESQALAAGEIAGIGYVPLQTARIRCFGGSTGHWQGWCRPFDNQDFAQRAWVAHSGWPITLADVQPYYPRAQEICELGGFYYDPKDWDLTAAPPLPLAGDDLRTRILQFSTPTRFGVRHRTAILAAANISLCLYSNVVRMDPTANGGQVERLQVATLSGNRFTVRAKSYVLAAGGIDNARLLLASDQVINTGIGNAHDLVGRYFADHIQLDTAGIFPLRDDVSFALYLEDRKTKRRVLKAADAAAAVMGYMTLSENAQRTHRTLNYSCKILNTYLSDYYLHSRSQEIIEASALEQIADKLRTIMSSVTEAVTIAGKRAAGKKQTFYKLVTTQEQAPNPLSRVTLGHKRDALGVRQPRLQWQLTDLDRHTLKVAVQRLVQAFSVPGIARLQVPLDLDEKEWPSNLGCSWHHCCTTRMHADPKQGVVDADCRVHGMRNLFVAGSSVFTTSGHGNPTLTIVALSLRLADRLRKEFT
jgi:choline dehydrogenase-like flavoprotein